jgi:hypothetical protein
MKITEAPKMKAKRIKMTMLRFLMANPPYYMEPCPRAFNSLKHQLDLLPCRYSAETLLTRFLAEMQIHFLN